MGNGPSRRDQNLIVKTLKELDELWVFDDGERTAAASYPKGDIQSELAGFVCRTMNKGGHGMSGWRAQI